MQMTERVVKCAVHVHQVEYVIGEDNKVTHGFDEQELEHVGLVVHCRLAFVPEDLGEANNAQTVE
jgi:hypothetical protein